MKNLTVVMCVLPLVVACPSPQQISKSTTALQNLVGSFDCSIRSLKGIRKEVRTLMGNSAKLELDSRKQRIARTYYNLIRQLNFKLFDKCDSDDLKNARLVKYKGDVEYRTSLQKTTRVVGPVNSLGMNARYEHGGGIGSIAPPGQVIRILKAPFEFGIQKLIDEVD